MLSTCTDQKKILVLGVGRSGTTSIYHLIQQMLEDQIPGATDYVYEPFLWNKDTFNKSYSEISREFQEVASVSFEGIYHHKQIPLFCDTRSNVPQQSQDWLQSLVAPREPKLHSLTKMIRANGRLGLLQDLLPDVKIIAIMRNPLEVINSSIKMFSFFGDDFYSSDYPRFMEEVGRHEVLARELLGPADDAVEKEYHYWAAMNRHLVNQSHRNPTGVLPILHEQFVADRERIVRQICEFTGLKYDKSYLAEAQHDVGPVRKNENHITVRQYLFLEDKLSTYKELAAQIAPLDLDDTLVETKERFITSDFSTTAHAKTKHFNSLFAQGKLSAQEQRLNQLKAKVEGSESLECSLREREKLLEKKNSELETSQAVIQSHEKTVAHKDSVIRVKDDEIIKKDAVILEKVRELAARESRILEIEKELAMKHALIHQHEGELARKNGQILKREEALAAKDVAIRKRDQEIARHATAIDALEKRLNQKDEIIESKLALIREKNATVQKAREETTTQQAICKKQRDALQHSKDELEKLKTQLNNKELALHNKFNEVASLEKSLSDGQSQMAQLQQERDRALQQQQQLEQTLAASREELQLADAQRQSIAEQLEGKESIHREQRENHDNIVAALRGDIQVQNDKLVQMNQLMAELRKVSSYPLSQIDRKLRSYKKLIETYHRIKPSWHSNKNPGYNKRTLKKLQKRVDRRGVDLGEQPEAFFGKHRSGWSYAVSSITGLNNPEGIYLDTFIERTFCWSPNGIHPHQRPWIGFIHVPPFVPGWFQYNQANHAIFETPAWKESLPHCKGLFTLSEYHRDFLQPKFDFPVESLIHPTEIPEQQWSWEAFQRNPKKRIVQLGWWLRKLHAIYQLPESPYQKTLLKVSEQDYLNELFRKEKQQLIESGEFSESMYSTVEVLGFLPNNEYDQLLSQNVVFLNLYDSSANNSVIECIARGTPLLINPIAPVVEYLGEDYPLYYNSFSEAVEKASDFNLIREANYYLTQCITRKKLTGEYFKQSIQQSQLLLNAYQ